MWQNVWQNFKKNIIDSQYKTICGPVRNPVEFKIYFNARRGLATSPCRNIKGIGQMRQYQKILI